MTVHYTPALAYAKGFEKKIMHRKVTAFKFVDYSKEGTSTFLKGTYKDQ